MVLNRPVLENMVDEIRSMWPQATVSTEQHDIISKALKNLNTIVTGYYWCNNALLISFLVPPFLLCLKRYAGYDGPMLLHFFYWFPYDPYRPVRFELTLVVQTWQALIVVWSNICSDLLFCVFLSHITTQFDLLSARIRQLIYIPLDNQLIASYPLGKFNTDYVCQNGNVVETFDDKGWEEKHQKEIIEILMRHRALIRLSKDIENIFSFTLLMNFFNSSVNICFCGFCCVVVEKWNESAYKSFLLTALSQTWLFCWYGQKLLDSSNGVADALYCSGWYKASKKVRSSILIMLHRSQNAVYITTYGFSVVSLGSFTTIIKTAWSYFTLLLNTYNQ